MGTRRFTICTVVAFLLAVAGCAPSPVDEHRRLDMEADIDEILSYELDEVEYGETRSCLPNSYYRNIRPLGDRHLLFEGRDDKQWVNVLRGRCRGLDAGRTFFFRPAMSGRMCDKDHLRLGDEFNRSASGTMGPTCTLGQFKPVSKAQVVEIEDRLEMR